MEKKPKAKPIIYVARDIERTLGIPLESPGYFVITNANSYAKEIAHDKENVLLIEEAKLLDTHELLSHPIAEAFINHIGFGAPAQHNGVVLPYGGKNANGGILVFKNTRKIQEICNNAGWPLLNPNAKLSKKIEEKISQVAWLGDLQRYLPHHEITTVENTTFVGDPIILQFNHAHTGSGTLRIESQEQLDELSHTFPKRDARITEYIEGPVFTINAIVTADTVLLGNISYQITGLSPFTSQPFATIGNDWALAKKVLETKQRADIQEMTTEIGNKMRTEGWRGLFGVDVVIDEQTGNVYLIEINARQPASSTFESQLQKIYAKNGLSVAEAHILALLGQSLADAHLGIIETGAQIVQRVTDTHSFESLAEKIEHIHGLGMGTILYENTKKEADLLRIQTPDGVMEHHGTLNEAGQKLKAHLETV